MFRIFLPAVRLFPDDVQSKLKTIPPPPLDRSLLSANARPSEEWADAGPMWYGLRFMLLCGMGFASTWEARRGADPSLLSADARP